MPTPCTRYHPSTHLCTCLGGVQAWAGPWEGATQLGSRAAGPLLEQFPPPGRPSHRPPRTGLGSPPPPPIGASAAPISLSLILPWNPQAYDCRATWQAPIFAEPALFKISAWLENARGDPGGILGSFLPQRGGAAWSRGTPGNCFIPQDVQLPDWGPPP